MTVLEAIETILRDFGWEHVPDPDGEGKWPLRKRWTLPGWEEYWKKPNGEKYQRTEDTIEAFKTIVFTQECPDDFRCFIPADVLAKWDAKADVRVISRRADDEGWNDATGTTSLQRAMLEGSPYEVRAEW